MLKNNVDVEALDNNDIAHVENYDQCKILVHFY